MNFSLHGRHSVILMSLRPNAPYEDELEEGGTVLIYEGHDAPKSAEVPNPKLVDQPEYTPSGNLSENGKFHAAAQDYKAGRREPEPVRVYEKLHRGIWSYNGLFELVDSYRRGDGRRQVFKFRLVAVQACHEEEKSIPYEAMERRRVIPTAVKLEVWKRDKGRCVQCGATDELHFDHILPVAKGGTSLTAENVQLLCARHNLQKSDKIL